MREQKARGRTRDYDYFGVRELEEQTKRDTERVGDTYREYNDPDSDSYKESKENKEYLQH